jgi:hypothetical protein
VGDRLARQRARQHSNLTISPPATEPRARSANSPLRIVVLILLALDGVISAVLGALFLLIYIGPVPFPVSALLSGLVNALLVWAGLQWTSSPRAAAIALWTWLFTLAAMTFFSWPGGDVLFGAVGGPAFDQWSPFVLLVLGVAPPAVVLWRAARRARGLR